MPRTSRSEKRCARCGRPFAWRKKWASCWEQVRYCGERCRRQRLSPEESAIQQAVFALLEKRRSDSSICPSEVARQVLPEGWRDSMPMVRSVAKRLAADGFVVATQGKKTVDAVDARGPIRLRRGPRFPVLSS